MKTPFEIIGYHIDYRVAGKYRGSVTIPEPDRKTLGYDGKQTYVLQETITTTRSVIKAGTTVTTECIPLCGKLITKNMDDRFGIIEEHYNRLPYKRR